MLENHRKKEVGVRKCRSVKRRGENSLNVGKRVRKALWMFGDGWKSSEAEVLGLQKVAKADE